MKKKEHKETETASISIPLESLVGNMRLVKKPSPFPQDKRQLERFVVQHFAEFLSKEGSDLQNIRSAPDDSFGKPDVLADVGSRTIGIQLTELKIEHRPSSRNVARQKEDELCEMILGLLEPHSPLLVNVFTTCRLNRIPKLTARDMEAIAQTTAEAIKQIEFGEPTENPKWPMYHRVPVPNGLHGKISHIFVQAIPSGWRTGAPGRDGLYVKFDFDQVMISDSVLQKMISKLVTQKSRSVADVLLVWCYDQDFWGQGNKIASLLVKEGASQSFPESYLLIFESDTRKLYRWK